MGLVNLLDYFIFYLRDKVGKDLLKCEKSTSTFCRVNYNKSFKTSKDRFVTSELWGDKLWEGGIYNNDKSLQTGDLAL